MRPSHRLVSRLSDFAPGGARVRVAGPVASLTFDDFPRSAWTRGGPILTRHGVRASYYPAGGFCGRFVEGNAQFTADDLREVRDAGHEIGCHTFSHRPAPDLSAAAFAADLDGNAAFLAAEAGVTPRTFAYPFGLFSPTALGLTRDRFAAARGVRGGVNVGAFDPRRLAAVPLETRSWSAARIEAAVARTVARDGWLVLYSHDVSDEPTPYGCTPRMMEHALETLARAEIAILPVAEAPMTSPKRAA